MNDWHVLPVHRGERSQCSVSVTRSGRDCIRCERHLLGSSIPPSVDKFREFVKLNIESNPLSFS